MVLKMNRKPRDKDESLLGLVVSGLTWYSEGERTGRLYASSDSLCEKKAVLDSNTGGTQLESATKTFYIEGGNMTEDLVRRGLENKKRLLWSEYKIPDIGINVGGRIDGIIALDDRLWVLEIKQINNLPSSPKPIHAAQATTYSAFVGLPAVILYIDRKVAGFEQRLLGKSFVLDTSYENRFKYLFNLALADLCNENKVIPRKPDHMKKSWCQTAYCNWQQKCWDTDTNYDYWLAKGFEPITRSLEEDLRGEAFRIVSEALEDDIVLDRMRGVLNHIQNESRYTDAVEVWLKDKNWKGYVV